MIKILTHYIKNGEKASDSITQSAILIAALGLLSRFLGLIRDRLLADRFGAGDVADVYYAAFKIPDLIYNLLILGALSAAFVPVFSGLLAKEKNGEAWKLVNIVLSVGFVFLLFVSVFLFIFAPSLVGVINFGFPKEKQELVTSLTRVMLFSPIFLGISGIIGGILNSFRKFFFYSLAPVFYNLGIILGISVFTRYFGPIGLAWGVVLGSFLHLLVQLPEAWRSGFGFSFLFDTKDDNFKKIIKLMIPRTMSLAVSQTNILIITTIASTLASGSLAVFNFANNLQSVPLGIFGVSFALAAFPTLSSLWAGEDRQQFTEKFTATLCKILFFVIPASGLIFALRAQMVRVILGTGKFDWGDTILTLNALGIFALSLWAQGIIPLVVRTFYVTHDTKTPFLISLFCEGLNLAFALFFAKKWGVLGLVGAFSLSSSVNAVWLLFELKKKIGILDIGKIFARVGKIFFVSFLMVITIQSVKELVGAYPFGNEKAFLGIFTQLALALSFGVGVFVFVGKKLDIPELEELIAAAKKKLRLKSIPAESLDQAGGIGGGTGV